MYEIFERLCRERGVKPYQVSKATGITTAALSSWKMGRYSLKQEKLQKIADYFQVSLEYLMTGEMKETHYLDDEAAELAQEVLDNKDLRALLDAGRKIKPEDLRMFVSMMERLKETNPDG